MLSRYLIYIILIYAFIHTVSYGIYLWNKKNRTGATAVFVLALIALTLPLLTIYFRG